MNKILETNNKNIVFKKCILFCVIIIYICVIFYLFFIDLALSFFYDLKNFDNIEQLVPSKISANIIFLANISIFAWVTWFLIKRKRAFPILLIFFSLLVGYQKMVIVFVITLFENNIFSSVETKIFNDNLSFFKQGISYNADVDFRNMIIFLLFFVFMCFYLMFSKVAKNTFVN